jgi:LysM repeat protein
MQIMKPLSGFLIALLLLMGIAACSVGQIPLATLPNSTPELTLQPYQTITATHTPTLAAETPTPLPSPTPTPRTHTVKQGELISSIALRYGINSQQLLDANPETNPNMLIAGTVLIIPVAAPTPEGFVPSPTPLSVLIGSVNCHPVSTGGAWCFALVTNPIDTAVENVSALLRLADGSGAALPPIEAYTPLNLLPAGGSLPLAVYLPGPLPSGLQASLELRAALPLTADDLRYLPATLENTTIQIIDGGLSAEASSEVLLGGSSEDQASQIWVAAVAYDFSGNVVGVRRWESPVALVGGGRLPLVVRVYSAAGAITRVDLLVEARR